MEAIIYGGGRLATLLAPKLVEGGYEVTVVDSDAECLESMAQTPSINTVQVVDSKMQDYLSEARVATTELLVALSEDDHQNALVAQVALHVFKIPSVVCRLDNPELRALYTGLGLKTVGLSELELFNNIQTAISG